jgi:hypothetical protein
MPAKAMVPVEAFPVVHLAPCMALGFVRHPTVRRHFHVSTLIHRFRGHGPLLQEHGPFHRAVVSAAMGGGCDGRRRGADNRSSLTADLVFHHPDPRRGTSCDT